MFGLVFYFSFFFFLIVLGQLFVWGVFWLWFMSHTCPEILNSLSSKIVSKVFIVHARRELFANIIEIKIIYPLTHF